MSDKNIQPDERVVEQLTDVAETMGRLLDKVMEKHEVQSKDLDYFREDLAQVRNSIRNIAKVLHEGNGEKPLISRVAILEREVDHIYRRIEGVERDFDSDLEDRKKTALEEKKGNYTVAAAVVSGIAGLIASIISLLVK